MHQHITLPAHWRYRQRLKNTVIFYTLQCVAWVIRRLPYRIWRAFAYCMGSLAAYVARQQRTSAMQQLAIAMPELTRLQREHITRRMFVHLSQSVFELGHLADYLPARVAFAPGSQAVLEAAIQENKGVIATTGHIGNWELLAQFLSYQHYPVTTFAKPLYDPRLTTWADTERRRYGLDIIWRGHQKNARHILTTLKQQRVLALLVDQHTKVDGVVVPFFGQPTFTPNAPAVLALRFNIPLIVGWSQRTAQGHHMVHMQRIDYDHTSTVISLTAHMNVHLENAIRQSPEQWVWLHQRWK